MTAPRKRAFSLAVCTFNSTVLNFVWEKASLAGTVRWNSISRSMGLCVVTAGGDYSSSLELQEASTESQYRQSTVRSQIQHRNS
jgi:hypothetical protein